MPMLMLSCATAGPAAALAASVAVSSRIRNAVVVFMTCPLRWRSLSDRLGARAVRWRTYVQVAGFGQIVGEQAVFDIAVALRVGPVAEEAVAEFVTEQGDNPVLCCALGLAEGGHREVLTG